MYPETPEELHKWEVECDPDHPFYAEPISFKEMPLQYLACLLIIVAIILAVVFESP